MFGLFAALSLLLGTTSVANLPYPDQALALVEQTATPSSVESTTSGSVREKLQDAVSIKKAKIEEIRNGAKVEIEKKREEFKTKLATVKDAKKEAILTNLVNKFDSINIKWVDHWKQVLDQLSNALDRIDARVAKLDSADTTAYDAAAKAARQKIADANTALETQAANSYIFSISSVSGLGKEVKDITAQFRTDIEATHAAVKAAREAVKSAFEIEKGLAGKTETTTP